MPLNEEPAFLRVNVSLIAPESATPESVALATAALASEETVGSGSVENLGLSLLASGARYRIFGRFSIAMDHGSVLVDRVIFLATVRDLEIDEITVANYRPPVPF